MRRLRLFVSMMALLLMAALADKAFAQIDITLSAYGKPGEGWMRDNILGNWGTSPYQSTGDAVKGYEQWKEAPGDLNGRILYKSAWLPEGTYVVTADVNAQMQGGKPTTREVFFYAADMQMNCYGDMTQRTLTLTIGKGQVVEIGVKVNEPAVVNWVSMENLKVTTTSYASVAEFEQKVAADRNANVLATGEIPTNTIDGWSITGGIPSWGPADIFQLNTWSVEGASDGSGMVTPFLENWINIHENSSYTLSDKTISYTVTGLEQGWYEVSGLVRALNETYTGLHMQYVNGVYMMINGKLFFTEGGCQ